MAIDYKKVAARLRAEAKNMELDVRENYSMFGHKYDSTLAMLQAQEDAEAILEAARLVSELADEVQDS